MSVAETLGDLIERGARVRWVCDIGLALGHVPHHGADLDLRAVAATWGPDFVLANRRPRCPAPNCPCSVDDPAKHETCAVSRPGLDCTSQALILWDCAAMPQLKVRSGQ